MDARRTAGRGLPTGGDTNASESWIGGVQSVLAALEAEGQGILEVRLARRRDDSVCRRVLALTKQHRIKVRDAVRSELDALLPGTNHQGVAARRAAARYVDLGALLEASPPPTLLICLDEITSPHNLGAILRSAWAFGADGVILPSRRSVGLTEVAVKTAAGAAAHVPVARVGNLTDTLERLKVAGFWVLGADAQANTELTDCDLGAPTVIVLGNEERGLRPRVRKTCDQCFAIPMHPRIQGHSLNVSVAAAVALSDVFRARAPSGVPAAESATASPAVAEGSWSGGDAPGE